MQILTCPGCLQPFFSIGPLRCGNCRENTTPTFRTASGKRIRKKHVSCLDCGVDISTVGTATRWCDDCRHKDRRVRPSVVTQSCLHCGEDFQTIKNTVGAPKKYCSRKCGQDAKRIARAPKRYCHHCDTLIPHASPPGMKYCNAECKWEADILRRRAVAGDPYPVECAFCGDIFIKDPLGPAGHQRKKYCGPICTQQASRDGRRARIAGLECDRIDRHAVFERDGYTCGICHEPVDRHLAYPDGRSASLDHVVPIARGGSHTYANVQCSHLDCNVRAHTKGDLYASTA